MEVKLLIFDLDGTLADTLHTIRDAVNMCMEHFGYPRLGYAEVRKNVGNGVRYLIKHSLPERVEDERFEEILTYFQSCYRLTHDKIEGCYEGLYDVVMELYRRGYRLAVLSNKPDPLVKGIIQKLFPEGVMKVAMGQTELPRKPDPTVPLMIAEQIGCKVSNAYFVGDSEVDALTAKNAGMHSVCVSWGFRDRVALQAASPEVIVDTPKELLNYFET